MQSAVVMIGFGLMYCMHTSQAGLSGKVTKEKGGKKERAGLIEIVGKPIFIDDYDRVLAIQAEAGEMEFSVAKEAEILKDSSSIEMGKISPKLDVTVKYQAGDKNVAYKIVQTSVPNTQTK